MSFQTYFGKKVLHKFPYYGEPLQETYEQQHLFTAYNSVDERSTLETYPSILFKNKYSLVGKEDIWLYNELFDSVKGRWGSLWVPGWKHDIILSDDILPGSITINIEASDFITYFPTADITGRFLFIYVGSYKWYVRRVVNWSSLTEIELDKPLSGGLRKNKVKMISFLYLCRFDIEEIEWEFVGRDGADCILDFKELPYEYSLLPSSAEDDGGDNPDDLFYDDLNYNHFIWLDSGSRIWLDSDGFNFENSFNISRLFTWGDSQFIFSNSNGFDWS